VEKVRVGVVGVGYFGQFHAEKYAKMDGADLVGVVDLDLSRAAQIARRCMTQPFSNYPDLFGRVQAVSVAVPTVVHHAISRDFLLRGIDVLLEKPMAANPAEAEDLIRLSESKGTILQVGHVERFNGAMMALSGRVRNPSFIQAVRMSPFPGRATDVNVVLDVMIHDIDIVLSLVDSPVADIQALGLSLVTRHADMANTRIAFENGSIAHLTASRISNEKIRRMDVFQPGGALSVDYLAKKVYFSCKAGPGDGGDSGVTLEEIPVPKIDPLEHEILAFLESVRNRKEALVTGWDGKRSLEVALRIIQEIEKKQLPR
jgi:predicted dehydrogenase